MHSIGQTITFAAHCRNVNVLKVIGQEATTFIGPNANAFEHTARAEI